MKRITWIGLVLALALVAAACDGGGETDDTDAASESQQDGSDITIGVAVHDNPADSSFWAVVQRGAEDAGEDLGIEVNVQGSPDVGEQAQIAETFVTQEVDGLIVSLANPEGMSDAVGQAVDAGIPVVTINSGVDVYQELGALTHVGQTETVAGEGAGERFNEAGLTNVLCVLHEEANIGLEQRCEGLESTFDGEVERFNVASTGTTDLAGTVSALQDKLSSDANIDGILALNPDIGIAARDAISAAGGDIGLATFDLSPDVLTAIEDGEILFAIDQQQYLQGYLPVTFLYLFSKNLNTVGGGQAVLTGPGFVDESNATRVKELADAGTR